MLAVKQLWRPSNEADWKALAWMSLVGTALVLVVCFALAGCSTSVSIKGPDGSTMSGRMINGSISYSTGAACTPAQPGAAAPLPPITPPPPTVKTMCEGAHCIHVLAAEVPDCRTQIATVKGTDITTYFAWLLGFFGAAITAVATGS
jgi:hypothetical protein